MTTLIKLWQGYSRSLGFFGKIRRITKWYRVWCRTKAQEKQARKISLKSSFVTAQEELHQDPQNEELQCHYNLLRDELKRLEEWQAEGQRIHSRVQWRMSRDKGTKEFYKCVQPKASHTSITELADLEDRTQSSQSEMETVCHAFVLQLYKQREASVKAIADQASLLNGCCNKLSPAMQDTLRLPLTFEELTNARKALAANKAPGPDGVVMEFYRAM
jgi:hypothetical protein